jgi:D-tyrosyl-tRNA(Tyr) deacylase
MRAVVQRVNHAQVVVAGETVGTIGPGLLVYLGVGTGDTAADRTYILRKVLNLRIFENDAGKLDKSVLDTKGELLVVSQFTLFGDVRRGNRPSFEGAMEPAQAEAHYQAFVAEARTQLRVATGVFRADMRVLSENAGPITIWIDSQKSAEMSS